MLSYVARTLRFREALPKGSLRARFASGAAWMIVGQGGAQAIAAIVGIAVARALGPENYGTLAIVLSTIAMFNIVAELSLGLTTNRFVAQLRHSEPAKTGRIIALSTIISSTTGCIISVCVLLLSVPLATHALRSPQIANYMMLGAPLLLTSAINGVQIGTLSGFESFPKISIGRLIVATVGIPLTITAVHLQGIAGVLIAQFILSILSVVWFRIAIIRELRNSGVVLSYRNAWQEKEILLKFAIPAMLAGIMTVPVIWAANAMLVRSHDGLAEMGFFNAANQWRNIVIWIPSTIGAVALPMLTSIIASGNKRQLIRALNLNLGVNLVLALLIAIPISAASYWVMSLYGQEFQSHWLVLVLLASVGVIQSLTSVIGHVLAGASRMWWGFLLNALWGIELLVFARFLIPYGAIGLGFAYLIGYLLHFLQVGGYTALILLHDPRLNGPECESVPDRSITIPGSNTIPLISIPESENE